MTPEVIDHLRSLSVSIAQFPRVALLSPGRAECELFPQARVLRRRDWDLGQLRRDQRFDLIIACHVFHYASDPALWFENVRSSCRALLIADLIRRKRAPDSELGRDCDAMRYAIDEHRPALPKHFDLGGLGENLLARHVYPGAANEYGPALHVMALIRGKLDGPLIHLAGYPTPLREHDDLATLHAIVADFESRGVPVWLGVAPARVRPAMRDYLQGLRCVSPALHSHAAEERGQRACWGELAWTGFGRARKLLDASKTQLEQQLGREVSTYLAPSGLITRGTARALAALGFDLCLSDGQLRSQHLPSVRSDYAGPSDGYPADQAPDVIGLDICAESQLQRRVGDKALARMFDAIAAQQRTSRARVEQLGQRVAKTRSA
jgi:hypothetical protein